MGGLPPLLTETHHRFSSRENHACCKLVLQMRVPIFKTNNLQKEKRLSKAYVDDGISVK